MLDTIHQYGSIFVGLGALIVLCTMSYWLYQIGRLYRGIVDNALRWSVAQDVMLTKVLEEKEINIDKELMKRNYVRDHKKNIERRLKDEILKKFFDSNES